MIQIIVVIIVICAVWLWLIPRQPKPKIEPTAWRAQPRPKSPVVVSERDDAFSHTRLEKFQNCPKAYEFRYLIRKEEAFGTIETFLGRTIHSVLEWAYENRNHRDHAPSINDALKQYEHLWSRGSDHEMKVVKRRASALAYMRQGREMLEAYWSRVFLKDRTATISLEKKFHFTIDDEFQYTGVIDRIARRENGNIILIDYKTGNPRYIKPPDRNHQLHSYAFWATQEHGVDELTISIEDLQGRQTLSHDWQAQSREVVLKSIREQVSRIQGTRRFAANPSVLCGWCGYRPFCKEGRAQWS
jgi:putative RecB family exonuclease